MKRVYDAGLRNASLVCGQIHSFPFTSDMSLVSADYGDSEEENDSLASDVVSEEDGEEEGIDDPSAADPFAAPPISVMAVPVVADLAQALVADAKRQSIASAPPNQPTVSSSSTDSGTVGSSAQRRINGVARCDQCSEHVAKYRCPACERLTCRSVPHCAHLFESFSLASSLSQPKADSLDFLLVARGTVSRAPRVTSRNSSATAAANEHHSFRSTNLAIRR